jgi:lysylphosphatidylglycerol synthetase-like protein (DUF2156 family)
VQVPDGQLDVPERRVPSGLFPSGPPRPTFREPHPVRSGSVIAGAAAAAVWMLTVTTLSKSLRGYVWLTVVAAMLAWMSSLALARKGDRGVAVGVAAMTGVALAIAVAVTVARWATTGWPL